MNTKYAIVVLLIIGALLFSGCTSSSNTGQSNGNGATTAPSPVAKVYNLGEKFTLGDLSYTLNSIDQIDFLGSEYAYKTTEGMYYLVEFTIENNGNSEKSITPSNDFEVTDEKGRKYTPDLGLSIYASVMGFEVFAVIEKLQPGIPKTGIIVFELPKETKGKLKVKPGMFSEEVLVEFG